MRRVALFLALVIAAAMAPSRAPGAESHALRVVVASYKHELAHVQSYATFRAKMASLLGTASSHFTADGESLVILPEAASLVTWLTGPRAILARMIPPEPSSSSVALASLGVPYAPQVAYYLHKCDGITPARALFLALTDTVWRAMGETFASLANEHDAWILVNSYVGDVTVVRDPVKVALLADPLEITRGYAYEAGCDVWNVAHLFDPEADLDPDGAADPGKVVAAQQRKAYLVPIEREQNLGLALSSESPDNVHPIEIPLGLGAVAKIGVLTSKDAWMNDLPERLDVEGMDLFVQPEAGGWAGVGEGGGADPWPQDALYRSAPAEVDRLPNTRLGAISTVHGNFFDLYFDGTPTLTADRDGRPPAQFLLGMEPDATIAARGPWVAADDPTLSLDERREHLADAGRRLLPRSGDPLENGQLEPMVWSDLFVSSRQRAPRVARAAATSVAIASDRVAPQQPRLAVATDGSVYAALTGFDRTVPLQDFTPYVGLSLSPDGGRTWAGMSVLRSDPYREFDQQDVEYDADLAVGPGGSGHLVWSDFRNQSWDLRHARFFPPVGDDRVDQSPSTGEGFPAENFEGDPDIAVLPSGRVLVAFDDARGKRADRGIVVARSDDEGTTWTETRADGEADPAPPAKGADAWHPQLAVEADGSVTLVWQDQRPGRNAIYRSTSSDGGETFGPPTRIGATATDAFLPVVAPGGHVAWEEITSDGGRVIRYATAAGGILAVDPARPAGTVQTRPAITVDGGGTVHVAWTDDRGGDQDVLLASLVPGTQEFSVPKRIDDGPDGTDARLPSLAATGQGLVVAWEDARATETQARSVLLPLV